MKITLSQLKRLINESIKESLQTNSLRYSTKKKLLEQDRYRSEKVMQDLKNELDYLHDSFRGSSCGGYHIDYRSPSDIRFISDLNEDLDYSELRSICDDLTSAYNDTVKHICKRIGESPDKYTYYWGDGAYTVDGGLTIVLNISKLVPLVRRYNRLKQNRGKL